MKFSVSPVAVAATLLPGASAFFRMPCAGPLLLERADPVVNPGAVSDHLHNIVGGNAFNFSMTYDSAVTSTCSSCKAKADKSNYWVPNLYVKAKNGSFHNVANGGATIYYLQRKVYPSEELVPFPKDFRMFAGDPMLRGPSISHAQKAVSFACLGGLTKDTPYIPNSKCPFGLRAQIIMPSCWDGKNLDSPDHKSHVAYPDGTDNGKCPSTHPKRFVTLFYEFLYDVKSWDSEWAGDKHPFVFSNGDPTGYSYHGDFFNGWDINILKKAINECNSSSGVIEECTILDLYTDREMNDCIVPPSIDEPTSGWMDKLPGCNPVQAGPNKAFLQINCDAPVTIGPKKKYSIDVSAKGWGYVGCAFDSLSDRTLSYRYATSDMTVPKCIDHCQSKNYTLAGLQYSEECWCGNTMAPEQLGALKCTMECAGNSSQFCGGWQKLSLYKQVPKQATMTRKYKRAHRI